MIIRSHLFIDTWLKWLFLLQDFNNATVKYSLVSKTVSLDEVYFPSMAICNMNSLRKSFVEAILEDVGIKALEVHFDELKHIIFSVFIFGGDYQPTDRDNQIIESKLVHRQIKYI